MGVAMAHFVGSFASGQIDASQIEPLVPQMARIFSLLLSDKSPWIVRHEACAQALCFATESTCPEITMRIVPESAHAILTAFIQHSPTVGMEVEENDFREMYQRIFDVSTPKTVLDDILPNQDTRRIVGSVVALAQDLELFGGSKDMQLCTELARLSSVIDKFLSK
ncbi:hypothetical protein GGI05_003683 [Coemansia sp. RSA 2603]|nr:hypothetical protein GGI05_003683 [Coemansia sp. RSA 2603]